MNKSYLLGIDTSCYTTSIAIIDINGNLILDNRKVLNVEKGKRGLRQSEALFQHIKNLPSLFEDISSKVDTSKITKVCISNKPRNLESSYMPVFLAGMSFGKTIASILNAGYEEFSHQEGHIEAIRWSSESLIDDEFIGVHISGGTTEVLKIQKHNKRYKTDILGGTKDISGGQLIDRIGVKMGLEFPAGKKLEEISATGTLGEVKLPVSTVDTYINFSGTETFVNKIIDRGKEKIEDIALGLFECISLSLYNVVYRACKKTGTNKVLLTGGVASNIFIRDNLFRLLNKDEIELYCGDKKYCTDNAVGTALLGLL